MVSKVNKAFREAVNAIRVRIAGLLTVITLYCLPVLLMTWYFQLHDELSVRIWLSVLVAVLPVLVFLSPPNSWTWRGIPLWSGIFLWLAVSLSAGSKFNLTTLSVNTVMTLVALPYCWLIWRLTGRNWLLIAGLLVGLAAMMVYWVAALSKHEDYLELLLLPLPFVAFLGVIWDPVAWVAFNIAEQNKNHRIAGPGSQALAMAVLILPFFFIAGFVPGELGLGNNWSPVSLTVGGVLLSAVISEPLRRFLVEWGELSPDPKPYQEEPQDSSKREK